MKFTAPIPGMSLTKEPGNSPWEQPPKYNTPEEALAFYMKKLSDPDTLDDLLFSLEQDLPLERLVDAMTSLGVMEGYHSIDVKMLISPVLHEHLLQLCVDSGIEVKEFGGPSREDVRSKRDKERFKILLEKALDGPEEVTEEEVGDAQEMLDEGSTTPPEASPEVPEAPTPKSLIPGRM